MKKALISTVAALLTMFGTVGTALANPSSFATGTSTAAATTTLKYMTPGTGTSTTPVYDAYAQTFSGGMTSMADRAGLLVQFTSSSSVTVLNANVEYSQDGIDWYRNYVVDPNQIGTSTTAAAFSVV